MFIGFSHRLLTICCALIVLFSISPTLQAEEPAAGASPASADPKQNPDQLNLIDVYLWTNSLPKDLVDLRADIASLADISTLKKQVPGIISQIEDLSWEETSLKSNPNLTFHAINSFEAKLDRVGEQIARIDGPIQKNISILESWHKKWLAKESKLEETIDELNNEFESGDMIPEFYTLSDIITTGKDLIRTNLKANLLAGHEIGTVQNRVYEMSSTAPALMAEANVSRTQQTSPSMLTGDFYRLISKSQFYQAWDNLILFVKAQVEQISKNVIVLAGAILAVILLAIFISFSKELVKSSSPWMAFASRPVVAAIFIFSVTFSLLNPLKSSVLLPNDWDLLIYLPLLFSVAMLSESLFKIAWQVNLTKQLLLYFGIAIILTVINTPSVLFYLFVFYISVGIFFYYLLQLIRHRANYPSRWKLLSVLTWFVFPLFIIVIGVGGFDRLAVVVFGRILAFFAVTLTIRLMLMFSCGLLELLLNNTPWKFISDNSGIIVKQLRPLLALLHFILWIAAVLVIAWVFPTLNAALGAMSSVKIEFMALSITPDSVLTVVLTVYVTLLVSRATRAFLLQQVLPFHKVDRGVQISIARLVHYAIMAVGFIVLLKVLGFGMNQITILGGALGVGIGFGLQAIVNNFVSGLILLFERPIKVGDMIDVGTQIGEVKELGLRATTVQTFDNAEVVIPNSQLISANVTNWTLADKKIRVKIPVGVAYGTDVSEVLRILLACAEANPSVLSTPKPTALFLAFGASSLDFELRVWIADFNDKYIVLSELNQDIEAEFDAAGIEIPFPQTDLHLRSVDQGAADKLHGTRTQAESTSVQSTDNAKKEKEDAKNSPDR